MALFCFFNYEGIVKKISKWFGTIEETFVADVCAIVLKMKAI
ncbi:hypothetical protein PRJBM_01282 [Bartonella henselae]|nr:hypothetical protein Q654_01295 [Bartonella henselae JK 50]ETS08960.1 hypothetical protein Q655_01248 [Bartonella henselae JK 51]CDO40636.1 hypothetical protein PRJBM_01282 [Bartonella henselae]CUH91210.1 hypothetical protein BM1374164_01282 [Bartonella henselae]